nr:MAG TPA: hypothetical protein [Caudoviricetes sp.]
MVILAIFSNIFISEVLKMYTYKYHTILFLFIFENFPLIA